MIGRHLPSDANPIPKLYRMRIFAPNHVVAKSRFWYFLSRLRKIKKTNGEIVTLNIVRGTLQPQRNSVPLCDDKLREGQPEGALTETRADPRETPAEGQELRHLDPLRQPLRHAQHVQGVPGDVADRRRRGAVPGHGREAPRPLPDHPRAYPTPPAPLLPVRLGACPSKSWWDGELTASFVTLDPQGRRDREDGRHPPHLHPAAHQAWPQVPATAPRAAQGHEEAFRAQPALHFCMSASRCCADGEAEVGLSRTGVGLKRGRHLRMGLAASVDTLKRSYAFVAA